MALDIQASEVNMFSKMFNIVVKLCLWLITLLLLSYCFANKAEAGNKPPSNCFNNHICLKFDSKRRCVYWAKNKEGKFIKCYNIKKRVG